MKKSFFKNFIVLGLFSIFLLGNLNFVNAQISSAPYMAGQPGAAEAKKSYEESRDTVRNWAGNKMDSIAKTVVQPFVKTAAVFVLKIIQFLMYLSGMIFDKIVNLTVESSWLIDQFKESLISAWKILRDIANIFIVFSLLYLGIKTILNGNGFAEKKVLLNVLLAAVLINFSLVITQTVFEVSNIVGDQIAQQITFTGQHSGYGGVDGISSGLMGMIGPQNIMNMMWNNKFSSDDWDVMWGAVQTAIFTGVTLLFMVVIFFTASIMLMYRFILFIVLMITSPFGLISKLVPWFDKIGDWWWKSLKTQAIVLPAFFLTLYISILFISPLTSELNKNSGGLAAAQTAGATITTSMMGGAVEFFFSFFLIIGFLLLPLLVPSKVGAAGSSMMTNAANWTTNKIRNLPKSSRQFAGGAVTGGAARTGRYLVGNKFANSLGGSTEDKKRALQLKAQGNGVGAFVAQQRLKNSEGLKNKTFDIRNTKAGANLGFGKGIESWNGALKTRSAAYEKKKKEEMKAYGFDKRHEDPIVKQSIQHAERDRDRQEQVYKTAEIQFRRSGTDADRLAMDSAAESLKGLEKAVGKLKNIGDIEYFEQYNKKIKNRIKKLAPLQRKMVEDLEKEMNKSLQKSGESNRKKRDASLIATPTPPAVVTPPSTP